jgi:hypothetical protein
MTAAPLRDPIYQLNFVLWMLEDLPDGAPTHPFLRDLGYTLFSLGGPLPMLPEYRLRIAEAGIDAGQAPAPDVLAVRRESTEFLVIECKGASFGLASSNCHQARALLIVSADLRGPLGLPPRPAVSTLLSYLLPEADTASLQATLGQLREELTSVGLPVAPFSVFGLEERPDGLYLTDRHPLGTLPPDVENAIGEGVRIHETLEGDTGRRLYLIPWDPSVTQIPEERDFCQRILFERVLAEALSHAGRASIPGEVRLPLDDLLDKATFKLARYWRAREDVKQVIRAIRRFLQAAIEKNAPGLSVTWDKVERTLRIRVAQAGDHAALLRALEEAGPAFWLSGRDLMQAELPYDEGEP